MDVFYTSDDWRRVRYQVIRKSRGRCEACGRGKENSVILHVDHIKPRSKFPELELADWNLQVLCEDCNLGKSNTDCIDWRQHQPKKKKTLRGMDSDEIRKNIAAGFGRGFGTPTRKNKKNRQQKRKARQRAARYARTVEYAIQVTNKTKKQFYPKFIIRKKGEPEVVVVQKTTGTT